MFINIPVPGIVTPDPKGPGMWIHQEAWFHLGEFDRDMEVNYPINKTGNGVYIFMIDGKATIDEQELGKRDAIGVWDTDSFSLTIKKKSRILLLEVPMHYK